ncbi:helix-turn-helix domain-containing protein [Flavivirga aquimarina]|uniref:Helix-turn-helix domain-containing protein n=1 Tax=Flavivirga aquimarina TaxID=2027862 RepID=A0ABT8WFM2_9FLAO|nr:GyrI-like domain-containing protein [Flavivirga aquimarina]MDO5971959.1 helix-turn-helix domain-containing protein [Flavivirga aquimarina]
MAISDNFLDKNYIRRINLALNFIDDNLDSELLSLETVSKIALYSPFHFHRLFKAIIGETLNAYISRRRIEKAASVLMHKKDVNITEISLSFGFNSNSSFTRTFKKFYGVSPSEFRKQSSGRFSKISQEESKNGQENLIFEKYICNINNHLNWIKMNADIEIKDIPELHFACITHIGVDGIEQVFDRLIKWAIPKGFMQNSEAKLARIFHDSFKITAPNKVRMSVSLITKSDFVNEGEIHKISISRGTCIVGRFEILPKDFEQAWTSLFVWMHDNGYKKSDKNPFEIYHNDFREHPENKFIVDLHIPIE